MKPATLAVLLAFSATAAPALAEPPARIFDARLDSKPTKPTAAEKALLERQARPVSEEWNQDDCKSIDVQDVAEGAFTRPDVKQRAVLYHYCEIARQLRAVGIAVFEGGRVVAHVVYEGGVDHAMRALPDLDGNGLSEILIASYGNGQGYAYGRVTLVELSPNGVRKLGQFESHHDDCGAVENGTETAAVLYVSRGKTPSFLKETFVKSCGSQGSFRRSGAQAPVKPQKDDTQYQRLR